MTVQQITDAASMARQRRLLEFCEAKSNGFRLSAEQARGRNLRRTASDYDATAMVYGLIAVRARGVLLRASEVSADDAEQLAAIQSKTAGLVAAGVLLPDDDAPPRPLVDLTAWLRGKVGRWLPWVASETWQTVGMLLLRGRP